MHLPQEGPKTQDLGKRLPVPSDDKQANLNGPIVGKGGHTPPPFLDQPPF